MTAIYTAPKTWSASELLSAANFNTHIRDMMDYLKARPVARAADLDGTVSNTTSTSFADITGASVSITTAGSSRLLITANVVWNLSSASTAYLTALIDGVNQGDATSGIALRAGLGTNNETVSFAFLTSAAVADGAHTVKLQYRTAANTLTVVMFSMAVQEVY